MPGTRTETLPVGVAQGQTSAGGFLAIAGQLALLLLVIQQFGVEQGRGLLTLAPLIFAGFVVHAWLPLGLRTPFFLLLSLAGFGLIFEVALAGALIGIGLALIGICHLPLPWLLRIGLLLACGALLTAMRANWIDAAWATRILPILGSIFMFRLVLYVYDLRTENSPASLSQRLSYFFLLPNVLFPLFPIVDWKAYRRTWFDKDALQIYAKGIGWMLRGVIHLLLYRLIYRNFTPGPEDVVSAGTLVLYMVSSYALYLRVSGLFHLVIGMLCLFGFNLPETHHHYFLASGFNDLWRRINIYWKDFMMKIVYYPIFVRMRRRNATRAMVVATVVVFMVSWLLHSYQWFWILGDFPLTWVDVIFWNVFAVTVLVNSLLQAKYGAPRRGRRITPRAALVHAAKVVAMFSWMCLLWSFWTGTGIAAFGDMLAASTRGPAVEFAWLGAALVGAVLLGAGFQLFVQRPYEGALQRASFGAGVAGNLAVMLALLWLGTPELSGLEDVRLVSTVRSEGLSERDEELRLRGYYEELLEGEGKRGLGGIWEVQLEKPADWVQLAETEAVRKTSDMREKELVPDLVMEFRDALLTTNSHGMRDREYAQRKPPGTYRLALLGASIEMGSGVAGHEVFEELVERRLNDENTGASFETYEILNFSVSGYTPLTQVPVYDQRVTPFDPDVVLLFAHPVDGRLMHRQVERLLEREVEIPYAKLATFLPRSGLGETTAENANQVWMRWRDHVTRWVYATIADACRVRGSRPVWVYLQYPPEQSENRIARGEQLRALAEDAGFVTIVLDGANIYPAGRDWRELILAPWDDHPNPEGHQLIADELYRQLLAHETELGLGLTGPAH